MKMPKLAIATKVLALNAINFPKLRVGMTVTLNGMPCDILARNRHSVTLRLPEPTKWNEITKEWDVFPAPIRKMSLIQIRTADKKKREAQTAKVAAMRTEPEVLSRYFPNDSDLKYSAKVAKDRLDALLTA